MKTRITLKKLNKYTSSYDVLAIRTEPGTYALSGFGRNMEASIRLLEDAGYRVFKLGLGRIQVA